MARVTIIRHAESLYPKDLLSDEGKIQATASKERFGGFSRVVTSSKNRARQTAEALGHSNSTVDARADEYEAPDINTPTAREYVLAVNSRKWPVLKGRGGKLLDAIKDYGDEKTLIITHNAIMSAVLRLLTNEITDFPNLGGFEVVVHRIAIVKWVSDIQNF